jgi:hypothetical protein
MAETAILITMLYAIARIYMVFARNTAVKEKIPHLAVPGRVLALAVVIWLHGQVITQVFSSV